MKTILVVDDENRIRKIYATLLSSEGYHVIDTAGAIEANEVMKTEPVDLVLLDLRMPEVNGNILNDVIEVFYKKVKVVVSSVYTVERQKKIVPRATDYHDKSHGIDVLLKKIQAALQEAPVAENII